ncbi:MAG: transglutaminase-like domain-containing protein [Nanoarchaeota archaeon]
MKKMVVIFLLLMLPTVIASPQNYDNFKTLDLSVHINGNVSIIKESRDSRLEDLDIFLVYYPKNDKRQDVTNKEIIASQPSKINNGDKIQYHWDDDQLEFAEYGIKSTIRTTNEPRQISHKINYPLRYIPNNLQIYLEASEFIDITPKIISQAQAITEGEDDYYVIINKLAEWTRTNVNYTLLTLTSEAVQKSSWVLDNKIGVCDELTNLFISMARAVGIPARFISGTAYTNIGDRFGNHGWAEVWFPNNGWLPVDVTYGQYGWIDPTHVKLQESQDSGDPAVNFVWRSYKTKIDVGELAVDVTIDNSEKKVDQMINLTLTPLKEEVKFGSFLPVEARLINRQDYYLPVKLKLTTAPGVYNGVNEKHLVLKPREERTAYFIVTVPDDINKNLTYTSQIAAETTFLGESKIDIIINNHAEFYSLDDAIKIVKQSEERAIKNALTQVTVICTPEKETYYTLDTAKVNCNLKNNKKTDIKNLNLCVYNNCIQKNIPGAGQQDVSFNISIEDIRTPVMIIETNESILHYPIEFKIIKKPNVIIKKINLEEINYKEEKVLEFILSSDTTISDIKVEVNGIGATDIQELVGDVHVTLTIKGAKIKDDKLKIIAKYKDQVGKEYTIEQSKIVKVMNIPMYRKIINFFYR